MQRLLICPACGRETDKLVEGLCEDCYRKEHPLLELKSDHVELHVCRICGSLSIRKDKWLSSREDLEEDLEKNISKIARVRGLLREVDIKVSEDLSLIIIKAKGRASNELRSDYVEEHVMKVLTRKTVCEACLGQVSRRKHALIQIRARDQRLGEKRLKEISKIIEDTLTELSTRDPSAVPVEVQQKPEGLDIYFSGYPAARKVAEALSRRMYVEVLETSKLIGVDGSGREKYKRTIRLLLPGFVPGDVVKLDQELYYVSALSQRYVELLNLQRYTKVRLNLTREVTSKMNVVASEEDLAEGLVLSKSGNFLQVLNLRTYETFEVYLEKAEALTMFPVSEKVKILLFGEKTYLIPFQCTPQEVTR
ncbi:MAG: NMD3-related protein [Infirmifilum sp.]|uniref:NMD3-related protein n=1 Tax=Infirmifilum TaxID=2856573 RepID=UPI003C76625F